MRNITVVIDDQAYHDIRLWCAGRDVSVSHVVRTFLQDLPRLKDCRRFPLPGAPEPGSLAQLFDELDIEDLAHIRRHLRKNRFRDCETVEAANYLMSSSLMKHAAHSLTVRSAEKHHKK